MSFARVLGGDGGGGGGGAADRAESSKTCGEGEGRMKAGGGEGEGRGEGEMDRIGASGRGFARCPRKVSIGGAGGGDLAAGAGSPRGCVARAPAQASMRVCSHHRRLQASCSAVGVVAVSLREHCARRRGSVGGDDPVLVLILVLVGDSTRPHRPVCGLVRMVCVRGGDARRAARVTRVGGEVRWEGGGVAVAVAGGDETQDVR